ncbi:D-alanine--D-alanine ligase [Desulfocucumis palustris]|uniref:D-alanine--D-alanine ligase n=1 Tax=Desulfocucumis palustris TaxID=1898651 RepID=A0A2L2XAY4_9FIRM|nr:ATP-grasp domain-containing protein [Desulfocucumis palustris]GBF33355.1 D-alanine--D-alanine ligase [Desulfocucumis palustris]
MRIDTIYLTGNVREEFLDQAGGGHIYNDHPSKAGLAYIMENLHKLGYLVEYFGGIDDLIRAYENKTVFPDNVLFFNASDGGINSNRKGTSSILLELLNVKYIGSDSCSRLIGGNKHFAKSIVTAHGLTAVPGVLVTKMSDMERVDMPYPMFVKPNREGSSIGISQEGFVENREQLYTVVEKLLQSFDDVLVEQYIPGYEVTNFIVGNPEDFRVNEAILCEYKEQIYFDRLVFGLKEKAQRMRTQYMAQSRLEHQIVDKLKVNSEKVFTCLNMRDFARIDYRVNDNGIYFIEVNGNPVISRTSEMGLICRETGTDFSQILQAIIDTALKRYQ